MGKTMGKKALSAIGVKRLDARMHADAACRGLYLRVAPTGARNWILRYQVNGRRRDMGLGGLPDVGLADARERAADLRKLIRQKVDPLEHAGGERKQVERQQKAAAWTFSKCAEAVHETLAPGFRNPKHSAQWLSSLATYAFPLIGDKPVSSVDVAAVLEVLRPIWTTKAETARRVRQRMDTILEWAVAHGYAEKNPVSAASVFLPKQREAAEHHAAMPHAQVPAFITDLRALALAPGRLALEFLILTAARSGEVRGATWAEVELQAKLWTVPAERMKAGREHRVPLSPQAVAVLEQAAAASGMRGDALIFPSGQTGKALSDMTLSAVLKRMKIDATPHGFRSSFRDWCAETGVSRELAERALAHAVKDATEAAYHRTDQLEQRRPLMHTWAAYLNGEQAGNVISIRGAR
jgi:integrase